MTNSIINRQLKSKINTRTGQALAELAVFGSLFLFSLTMLLQYALNFNYKQEASMLTYRRALSEAFELRLRGQSSQIISLRDRAFVDAQDPLGVPQHYPVGAGASVLWSDQTNYDFTASDLPRMVLDINGTQIKSDQPGINELRTAAWMTRDFREGDVIHEAIEAPIICSGPIDTCPDIYGGPNWEWKTIELETERSQPFAYITLDVLKAEVLGTFNNELKKKSADVDSEFNTVGGRLTCISGDCKEEIIAKVTDVSYRLIGQDEHGHDKYVFFVSKMDIIDYQEGDIDSGDEQQGIQSGYNKSITTNSAIIQEENAAMEPDGIRTVYDIDADEIVTRRVELNKGRRLNVQSEFPTDEKVEWVTPND